MPAVTLRDVALACGVSTYTVSKIVAGQAAAARIAPATVERVLAKIAELGYVPNTVARNLRAQRTGQIGVVLCDIYNQSVPVRDTFEGPLLRGLHIAAQEHCLLPNVVYPSLPRDSDIDPRRYFGSRVDGLLVRSVHRRQVARLSLHDVDMVPVVAVWCREVPDHSGFVDVDHYGGARLAVEHLLKLGHRRIAYLGPGMEYDHLHFALRYHGYHDALQAAGIVPRPAWRADAIGAILGLRRDPEPITAVFAVQDVRASALVAAFTAMGGRVPEDLSVVGFDNIANADFLGGGLTTIHQPIEEMGAQAVHSLVALLKGASVAACRTILSVHLVLRHTTAPPAGGAL